MDELVDRAQSGLEPSRDIIIYIMAETDQETNLAAAQAAWGWISESSGGGLAAWETDRWSYGRF